jgi:hypothetical protein
MTRSEKAINTRIRHKEEQERKQKELHEIKKSIINALREVLDSNTMTLQSKLDASKILIELIRF